MVPKLRFAGFNEPWSETSLGKISSFITSGSRDWAQYYADGGDKFIRMTNLVRDGITLNLSDLKFVRLPENSNEGKRTALQHHDILISITAELGKLGWVPDDLGTAYINQHTALVRPNLSIASSKFIANLLSTKKYNNILNQQNDSGAKSGLNLSTIKNFRFYATNKIEQTKIADFLSSVDEKIALLTKQYEQLCQYKKGMIQKIFSQELRFKDQFGISYPDWKKIKFSEIGTFYRGHSYAATDVTQNEDLLVLRSNNIQNNKVDYSTGLQFVTKPCKKDILLKNNDIIICMANGSKSLVGKSAEFLSKDTDFRNITVGAFCSLFRSTDSLAKYLFQTEKYYNEIDLLLEGTNINNLKNSNLEGISFLVPTSSSEKLKIVSLLASIDNKINKKLKELDLIKTWKQGLLQQMFV